MHNNIFTNRLRISLIAIFAAATTCCTSRTLSKPATLAENLTYELDSGNARNCLELAQDSFNSDEGRAQAGDMICRLTTDKVSLDIPNPANPLDTADLTFDRFSGFSATECYEEKGQELIPRDSIQERYVKLSREFLGMKL